ncbi:MAG: DUF4215 domain-containing protein, partial [Polyangia bacterium]|nr:DUF4215 domain-containing protein [Polyangia bacterium]
MRLLASGLAQVASGLAQVASGLAQVASGLALLLAAGLLAGCVVSFSGPGGGNGNNNNGIPPGCGNGVLDPLEMCDGTDFGDRSCKTEVEGAEFGELACSDSCRLIITGCHSCGNSVIDTGELCDDGSSIPGDGCDERCQIEHGWVCLGEPSLCQTVCGDGLIAAGVEVCDDGNQEEGDGCGPDCLKEPGWACDGEPSVCAPTCGNALLDSGEVCDDGDTASGDGCSPSCDVEAGWTCDGGEPTVCSPICGDGLLLGGEPCDDGNSASGDGCSPSCEVEEGWICDQMEPQSCTPICGDGLLLGGEVCDDGNLSSGDGCSSSCSVEPYYACESQPSDCYCVVYVNASSATGNRSGDSWANAQVNLRSALQAAYPRAPCELWLAAGTYYAFEGSSGNSFELRADISLYGGFTGVETSRGQRDWIASQVILHASSATQPTQAVRTVVRVNGFLNTLVDGVTITGANNGGTQGGGVALDGGSLTIRHGRIEGNFAADGGGGIWARGGQLTLQDVVVAGNTSEDGGGGIFMQNGAVAVLDAVSIEGNQATAVPISHGGGIWAVSSTLTVRSSQFLDNRAGTGGGLRVEQGALYLENSLLVGNETTYQGGGGLSLSNSGGAAWVVRSCTFHDNLAPSGGGYALRVYQGVANLWNSILWGTVDQQIFLVSGATVNLDRCDVATT